MTARRGAAPKEPPGRRLLRIGFGLPWLFDGILQAQPGMPAGLVPRGIEPIALSSPSWLQHVVSLGASAWISHPVQAATAAVWIQVGLGLWLLAGPHGTQSRLAGLASVGWGLVVWVFGESFGGLFAPGLTWLTGATARPARCRLHGGGRADRAARARLALPPNRSADPGRARPVPGRDGRGAGASRHRVLARRQSGTLASMVRSMSQTPQPGFLSGWVSAFAAFDAAHGFAVNLVVVAALTVIGGAFLSGRPQLIRPALGAFTVLGLTD